MSIGPSGLVIAVSDVELSQAFYCAVMQLEPLVSDSTVVMLAPKGSDGPWLLTLRLAGRRPNHPGGGTTGFRAAFFRVDLQALDGIEERLKALDGFSERHVGEFYEMVSGHDPDRAALGFWAPQADAATSDGPTFVPPSVYFVD